jgi:hypothetical protein
LHFTLLKKCCWLYKLHSYIFLKQCWAFG